MTKKVLSVSLVTASVLFSGCSNNQMDSKSQLKPQSHSISFDGVKIPSNDEDKRKILATSSITVDGKKQDISYNTILRSGEKAGNGVYGLIMDSKGNPILGKDGSLKISNDNDFASLLPVGDKLFMISHFETRPAAMYLTELSQTKDGHLKAISTKNIDFSSVNGLWVPCAGSVTPWGTHLGSEEYEPNAELVKENGSINDYYDAMAAYYGGDLKALNPYDYGWSPEVKVLNEKGDVEVTKHYSMGRFAHELAYVMPDEKTVFLSDDGTNVALFMFVADIAGDLSAGTLYAAKWVQKNAEGVGSADIKWVNLGHSSNKTIKAALDKKIKFSDLFFKTDMNKDGSCLYSSFKAINTTMGAECLKIKPGMEELASRMESRRYAAMLGATTEFRKMEGITYDSKQKNLYIAMSSIEKGMEDNSKNDLGGNNDIKLAKNKCGAVYELKMSSSNTVDSKGNVINSKFVPNFMHGLLAGIPDKSVEANTCAVYGLANPDNVTFIPNTNTIIIGEDTGSGHQNDYIWSYNIGKKQLTRILTTPYGSETTSPYYYNNINGHGYLMAVVQHPYGEEDAITKEEDMPKKANDIYEMRAYTGYVGPLPVISK